MKLLRTMVLSLICLGMLPLVACNNTTSTTPWPGYAHLVSAPTQHRPFLFIKCQLADVPTIPAGFDDEINRFTTIAGVGTGNLIDYFNDISYGALSLYGDKVVGWVKAPFSQKNPKDREPSVNDCANALPDGQVDFSSYYGIAIITNGPYGGGACYDGPRNMTIHGQTYSLACVVFDTESLWTWFAAHEIGHGLGLPHSFDNSQRPGCSPSIIPGEYLDSWDMMSSLCSYAFYSANFPNTNPDILKSKGPHASSAGPGMSLPNLLYMGWMPQQLPTYKAYDSPQVFKLAALSHPKASGVLGVKLFPYPKSSGVYFTVEYRQKDGWDAGIPENAVVIHEYMQGIAGADTPFSFLQSNSNPDEGAWLPGQAWTDPSHTVQVCVMGIDPTTNTATIQVGVPSPFCSSGPRVKILAPSNDAFVDSGTPFQLVASATSFGGVPLPDSAVSWQANGVPLGTGKTLTTTLKSNGENLGTKYLITVRATDSQGVSSTDSIYLFVFTPTATPTTAAAAPTATVAPPKPTVKLLSPANGEFYSLGGYGSTMTLVLSAQASAGVTSYAWSDSLKLFTDNKANDSLTLTPSLIVAPCTYTGTPDLITIKVTDSYGQTASAQAEIFIRRTCVN